jgi:hypothetical protein
MKKQSRREGGKERGDLGRGGGEERRRQVSWSRGSWKG